MDPLHSYIYYKHWILVHDLHGHFLNDTFKRVKFFSLMNSNFYIFFFKFTTFCVLSKKCLPHQYWKYFSPVFSLSSFIVLLFQFSSVTQSCPTLCHPMNHSTPGLPVHHQLPEFTQTHVHQVSDAIQPSHPLLSSSPPAPNPSQHQGLFQWVNSSSHDVAKGLFHWIRVGTGVEVEMEKVENRKTSQERHR